MKKYFIWFVILIFVGSSLFGYYKYQSMKSKINELREENTELIQVNDEIYKKYSYRVGQIKLEQDEIIDSITTDHQETVRNKTEIISKLHYEINNIDTRDSVLTDSIDGDSINVAYFTKDADNLRLEGYFHKQEPWQLFIQDLSYDLNLSVILTENNQGSWNTYVKTNDPHIQVSSIQTSVVPYDTPLKKKFRYTLGFGIGKSYKKYSLGATVGVAYNNHELNVLLQTAGDTSWMLLYQKQFEI